ncbi:MAG: MFS transporter [Nitriliruptorales bacterium]|nr:MFS transporter [Nitriliruptorales bacterium]
MTAGFIATFTVFGVAYSFGPFFGPMAEEFGSGSGATSAVFSITACLYFLLGAISGRATDRFGPRPVLLVGAVALGVGLAATATVDELWIGYVTYGLGVGVAVACGYVPMLAVVGAWFEEKRSLALGVTVAGVGVGTLTVAPLAGALISRIGWRSTYVVFAIGGAVLLLLAAAVVRRPAETGEQPQLPLGRAARTTAFASLYGSGLLLSLALFVPFVFLPPFAEARGVSKVAAAALVGVIGGTSVIGRLLLGAVGDRLGRIRTYQACFFLVAASFPIWLATDRYLWLVVFAVVLGFGYGGFIALNPAVVAELFGVRGLGGLIGALYTSAAIGALIGPPAAGFVIDRTGGYDTAILGAFTLSALSFVALLPLSRPEAATPWDR